MSLTAGTWVVLAVGLTLLSFRRPVWGLAFYIQTFFAFPSLWWWGDELPDLRYALLAGYLLAGGVMFNAMRQPDDVGHRFGLPHQAVIAIVLNATFVHFTLASRPDISAKTYTELLKYTALFFLMWKAVQTKRDLRIVLLAIALGVSYIGYEITINERGEFRGGRLEGVGAPAADSANSLADVMLVMLPLVGALVVGRGWRDKIVAGVAAPLALNVLLLCNSRGAFLGLAGAALSFVVIARGPTRKQALRALALGGLALYFLLGDPQIITRFLTTFSGSEERDQSAASRIEFWQAGLMMLSDYPLGDGGNSFKYVRGGYYLSQVLGEDAPDRSLHNGYLTEATDWGVQGLTLRLLFMGSAFWLAYRTGARCRKEGRVVDALFGICIMVSAAGYLIHCLFGSFLENEWGFWVAALLVRYSELYAVPEAVGVPQVQVTATPVVPTVVAEPAIASHVRFTAISTKTPPQA
jgi:O-antigen ligase